MLDTIVKNAKDDRKSQFSAEERINSNMSFYFEDMRLSVADGVEELEEQEVGQEVVQAESASEPELESLNNQLMMKEAKLGELRNYDKSLVESMGKEMSNLLLKLEEAEEEKAAVVKQVAEVDATARELQKRREHLVTGIRDKDEKLKEILKEKHRLENLIEEKVSESKGAKFQLEREIEDLKRRIENVNKLEVVQLDSESHNLRLQWLESIESRIETEERELECSVCLEVSPAIFSDFSQFVLSRI